MQVFERPLDVNKEISFCEKNPSARKNRKENAINIGSPVKSGCSFVEYLKKDSNGPRLFNSPIIPMEAPPDIRISACQLSCCSFSNHDGISPSCCSF